MKLSKFNSKDDLDAIMKLWLNSNKDAHSFIDKSYWESNYNMVREILPESDLTLYWIDNQIVGFIGIVDGYIAGIFIDKKYRNKGIGSQLIKKAKSEYNSLNLSVYKKNISAYNFYIKQGFNLESEEIDNINNQIEYNMIWNKKDSNI